MPKRYDIDSDTSAGTTCFMILRYDGVYGSYYDGVLEAGFFCSIILAFSLCRLWAARFLTCFLSAVPPRYVKHPRAGSVVEFTIPG